MLSSPPTISQEEDHDDDEANQSDSGSSRSSESSNVTESSDINKDSIDIEIAKVVEEDEVIPAVIKPTPLPIPTHIMYENRNILNLANNVWNSGRFIQFTVLPENNVNCFFQNRAQYWRLANNNCNAAHDEMDKCSCCDFSYPPQLFGQLGNEKAVAKNSITDSLMTFLKNNLVDYQNPVISNATNVNNISNTNSSMPMPSNNNNNTSNMGSIGQQGPNRRMYNNNNNAPYAGFQMMQQQQQYQNNQNNGYYGSNGGGYNNGQMNNGGSGGYNGTALALLNLMNASRNVSTAGAAFQATLNNSTRYFNNNNMNTNNNGFGLYKQF